MSEKTRERDVRACMKASQLQMAFEEAASASLEARQMMEDAFNLPAYKAAGMREWAAKLAQDTINMMVSAGMDFGTRKVAGVAADLLFIIREAKLLNGAMEAVAYLKPTK